MVWKNKWVMIITNAIIIGGYIAAILLMIHGVSTGRLGIAAYLVPIAILILMVLGWTVLDRRKCVSTSRIVKQTINECSKPFA